MGEIIGELNRLKLLGNKMPENYNVYRREGEWSNLFPERFIEGPENQNVDEPILLPHGWDRGFPEIDVEKIEKRVAEEGIEAIAWYRSYHWYPTERWGIYILDEGIYYIADRIFRKSGLMLENGRPLDTLDFLQLGFKLLLFHEFFHYITDVAASTLEVANRPTHSYYVHYVKNVYTHPRGRDEPLEEALANAFAYRRIRRLLSKNHYNNCSKTLSVLGKFFCKQPQGYSAFCEFRKGSKFALGERKLGICIREGTIPPRGAAPLERLFWWWPYMNFGEVPTYILNTPSISHPYTLSFIKSIPKSSIIRSQTFEEDLLRLSPDIRIKAEETLDKLGWSVRHRGLKFEKVKGRDNLYTVRVNQKYRILMRPENGEWVLLKVGKHDEIYRAL